MKKQNYTAIVEFEVLIPTDELETVGEKLKLSPFGEFCPDNSLRGYSLAYLIINPRYYKVTKVVVQGESLSVE
jgi:hypothetical protein